MNMTIDAVSQQAQTADTTIRYVVGFLFDVHFSRVALIRKQKPAWQAGLLNGIGGKVEAGEIELLAMRREFNEEAIYPMGSQLEWKHFAHMEGANNDGRPFAIEFFYAVGQPDLVRSAEAEQIELHVTADITGGWEETIGNLPWLVALARDFGFGKYPPKFVRVKY